MLNRVVFIKITIDNSCRNTFSYKIDLAIDDNLTIIALVNVMQLIFFATCVGVDLRQSS